jgi:ribonucleoside-diphosphate reductase beta chain
MDYLFKINKVKIENYYIMPSITEARFHYKISGNQFEYEKYFEAYTKALTSVWNYKEVSMTEDVLNWEMATAEEKEILSGILRAFTQIETVIGDYWTTFVSKIFPKPEIISMCTAYGFFETIHAAAYNHLSATLGIDEYEAYVGDPLAQQKVEYLLHKIDSPKVKLAVFSGAAEGVALFSAFSILLSFCKESKFKGLSEIISWSIADEMAHSDMGSSLFRDLVSEQGITTEEIDLIIEGFNSVLSNELSFLDNVFGSLTSINNIPKEAFYNFLKQRYNDRLNNLGLSPIHFIDYDSSLSFQVSSWFDPMSKGNVRQDFFAYSKDGSQYVSKPTFNRENVDWNNLDLT